MPSKELYLAAVEFQKAKLWEMLYGSDLFAVRYADGETGYASVMGYEKSHFALALYMGEAGLYSYFRIESLPEDASLSLHRECFLSQTCLSCSFEKSTELTERDRAELRKYGISSGPRLMPLIRKYEPFKYPWYMDDPADEQRLLPALKAGVEIARRLVHDTVQTTMRSAENGISKVKRQLGFDSRTLPVLNVTEEGFTCQTESRPENWPVKSLSPSLANELEIARLKKVIPEPGRIWYCHVMMFPNALEGEPPHFPAFMMLLDTEKGMVRMPVVEQFPEHAEKIMEGFLSYLNEQGKPECVYTQGRLTYYLLKTLAEQIGLALKENDRIPEIEEAEDGFIRYIESRHMGEKAVPPDNRKSKKENERNAGKKDQ
jgi:hypothetical protein